MWQIGSLSKRRRKASYSANRYQETLFSSLLRCENQIVTSRLAVLLLAGMMLLGGSAYADSPTQTPVAIPAYQFPGLIDGPVPDSLQATLSTTSTDMPKPYKDHCHVTEPHSDYCFVPLRKSRLEDHYRSLRRFSRVELVPRNRETSNRKKMAPSLTNNVVMLAGFNTGMESFNEYFDD